MKAPARRTMPHGCPACRSWRAAARLCRRCGQFIRVPLWTKDDVVQPGRFTKLFEPATAPTYIVGHA